jgi:hypothetical protein
LTTKKEQIERFQEIPEIEIWLNGCELKPATRGYYAKRLYEFLGEESPKEFVDRALKEPRQVSIDTKTRIAKVAEISESSAMHTRAAVKSFLEFYETQVHVNGKIKVRRKWNKPYPSWQNAEKVISKCREPYEFIFRFMLWSGLGQDEVI